MKSLIKIRHDQCVNCFEDRLLYPENEIFITHKGISRSMNR